MKLETHIQLTHHAYALIGDQALRLDLISHLAGAHNISQQANPDFFDRSYETFVIDDAREVHKLHLTRPIGKTGKKIFVLSMNSITVEAQNALLKLLEEPAEYVHFFLIVPTLHILLPTVQSRMHIIERSNEKAAKPTEAEEELIAEAKRFLRAAPAKRLEMIKKLTEDITKDKKTKQDAIRLLNAIQAELYIQKGTKGAHKELEVIEMARNYLNDRAPSVKMLLEYVAINL